MPRMVDPMDALVSFQEAYKRGIIDVQPGALDKRLFVHVDQPAAGSHRFIYVRFQGRTPTVLVNFTNADHLEGRPCFAVGVAVAEGHRKQGRAKDTVRAAIEEMRHGFTRAGLAPFYIEAIVHIDNVALQHVATATISAEPVPVVDSASGEHALQYLKKIEKI